MRFIEKEDCYLDTITGLEWSKEHLEPKDWDTAMSSLSKEWRLPTIEELLTLVDYKKQNPASSLPLMLPSRYWSATTYVTYPNYAWLVDFYCGCDNWFNKLNHNYVRAIRKGKEVSDEVY